MHSTPVERYFQGNLSAFDWFPSGYRRPLNERRMVEYGWRLPRRPLGAASQ